ncbi:MAG: hypothetical protein ACRDPE_18415 [Solirubrobacterales bacterium]
MKTIEVEARRIRRGDRVVDKGPDDATRIREVERVAAHLGGRELLLDFEAGSGLIVRPDRILKVDQENRLAHTDAYCGYSKVAPDADEIGAGDDVVVLDGEGGIADEGVLRDVEDERAAVKIGRLVDHGAAGGRRASRLGAGRSLRDVRRRGRRRLHRRPPERPA